MPLQMGQAAAADWERLKNDIIAAAPALGIDKVGFASAEPFLELKDILLRRREKGYECGFEEPDIDKRVYPELTFSEPRSIIAIAIAYPSKLPNPPRTGPGASRGIISRASWGEDYHHVLRRRLAALESFIHERVAGARLESMVDTGVLSDRAVAERAGIGWSGKNCSIITPEWGSWVYLGEMLTNLPFPSDQPITEQCGECTLCLEACPTQAFAGPGELDATRCISFLTQTKTSVPDDLKEKIGNRLYGCDTCQVVCPKNKGMNWTHQPELQPDPQQVKPLLVPLLAMSNKEYKEKYGLNASSWRGKKPIQRNAVIGLGHFKDPQSVPALSEVLRTDVRPELRETAAWALGKIGGPEASRAITEAKTMERDETVQKALERAEKKLRKMEKTV